ncbi:MAG TPA: prepilin-type N-terminal cleavage/methylation domain-containing protein [bacterium]|jgi:prepilin-type N-terminal cleavage/methylation domain-containing protein
MNIMIMKEKLFRSQRGLTLVEMLVALLIAGIFFSVFVGIVLATFQTLRTGDERTVAQQNARVAINFLSNDIRQTTDIAPLRLEEYRDWATGGFPMADDTFNEFENEEAWPIYRLSTDGRDPTLGDQVIDLDIDGGSGDGDEYELFRDDGLPYDVRALSPNRISLLGFGDTFYPNTQYFRGTFGIPLDLDGDLIPNPNALLTRVTYEHQLVEPLHDGLYDTDFTGKDKHFNMVVNNSVANTVEDTVDFVVYRTFETLNPKIPGVDVGDSIDIAPGPLANVSDQIEKIDQPFFRQPVADHVMNVRFRYWHISANTMIEIRYDPNESNIGGDPIDTDDGYYRYFNIWGDEIYVWYNNEPGIQQMIPLMPDAWDDADYDAVPPNSFFINGGPDGDDEFQRGILLFEGWQFVNAVSVSVRTANAETLNVYRSSINLAAADPLNDYDYGMGFIDFGLGENTNPDLSNTVNAFQPLYQGADNVRTSNSVVNGTQLFDFVEPNMNPNFDPSDFVTLQTFVSPPALAEKSDQATSRLDWGLSHKYILGG